MRIKTVWMLLSIFFLFFANCSSDKYNDIRTVRQKQLKILENYIESVEKARSAADIVVCVDLFTANMEGLAPEIENIRSSHPELGDKPFSMSARKMKALRKKARELKNRLFKLEPIIMKFSDDPAVQAAQKKFEMAMFPLRLSGRNS